MKERAPIEPLRPRDLALLLLVVKTIGMGILLPRRRARDQRADQAGLELKRRVLERLAAIDPEPAELDATLARIIDEIGPPTGPTRAIAVIIREEWQEAVASPEWVAYLLGEAIHQSKEERPRGR